MRFVFDFFKCAVREFLRINFLQITEGLAQIVHIICLVVVGVVVIVIFCFVVVVICIEDKLVIGVWNRSSLFSGIRHIIYVSR